MARNLQAKLPPSDTIRVFDINTAAAEKLVQEMRTQQAGGAASHVASSAGDAARDAVRLISCFSFSAFPRFLFPGFYDEFVLCMTCSKLGRLAGLSHDYCYTTKANPLRSQGTGAVLFRVETRDEIIERGLTGLAGHSHHLSPGAEARQISVRIYPLDV
jgi:hypothetical protein